MKTKDIVKVKNIDKYKNLKNYYGVVVSSDEEKGLCQVAFLDMENNKAVKLEEIKDEDLYLIIKNVDANGNQIKYLDNVELITNKYEISGLVMGQKGVVVEVQTQLDKALVDFTSVDKRLNVTGDCVLVECKYLKVLK